MTFSDVWTHLQQNWHKYGILYLVLKDIKGTYTWITKLKSYQDNLSWLWNKIKKFFAKIF